MKSTYHTNLLLAEHFGYDSDILKTIPRSTRYNWRQKNIHSIIGLEYELDDIFNTNINLIKDIIKHKNCYKLLKGTLVLLDSYQTILDQYEHKNTLLRKHKDIIIHSIERASKYLSKEAIFKRLSITSNQFHYWKNEVICHTSAFNKCFKQHPLQLSNFEIEKIKEYYLNPIFQSWSNTSIYHQMRRDDSAFYHISTFRKYIKKLGLSVFKPSKRRKKHSIGIRAEKPKEIIQMDYTVFRTNDHNNLYLSLIIDNFSRKILGFKTSHRPDAQTVLNNLDEVIQENDLAYNKPMIRLIVDGGSENNNEDVDHFCTFNDIHKQIAQKDIIFSNSMIDAVNSNLKYRFLYHHEFEDYDNFNRKLEK